MGISSKNFQQHLLKGLSSSFSKKKGQVVGFSKFVRRNLRRRLTFLCLKVENGCTVTNENSMNDSKYLYAIP